MNLIDRIDQRFGRLVVIGRGSNRGTEVGWQCRCDCGAYVTVRVSSLSTGRTRSCGCLTRGRPPLRHGGRIGSRSTFEYESWSGMKARCLNPRNIGYRNYGGRGITVCERWRRDFAAFLEDMGTCPPRHTLDRIDNSRGYEPDNCRWALPITQNSNKRTNRYLLVGDQRLTLAQAARQSGLSPQVVHDRLKRGWDVDSAATTPARRYR